MNIEAVLSEIDILLEEKIPKFKRLLNEPATDDEFKRLEEKIGEALPEEFKAFYRWHNGQKRSPYIAFHLETHEILMPIDDIIEWYDELSGQLEYGDIDEDTWKKHWIPFTDDGTGNSGCIDVSKEHFGRVVFQDHEGDEHVFSDSLTVWLSELLSIMKAYDYSEWDYNDRLDKL